MTDNEFKSVRRWVLAVAAMLMMLAQASMAAAAAAGPVAMVSDLQGKGTVVMGATRTPLALLADLAPGAQVELEPGARMVVLYLDGSGEYVFSGAALIAFGAQQPQTIKGAAAQKRMVLAGKAGSDVRLKPLGAVQGALVMRGAGPRGRIRLVSPGGTRTLDDSPEFRWEIAQAGLTYHFELTDDTGRMLYETDVGATSLRLPAAVTLAENVLYTWSVSARLPDGRKYSSTADFSIAPVSLRQQVSSLRVGAGAAVSERVAYASWLEQLGLKDEARPIWRALAAERPDDQRLQTLAGE